MTNGNVVIVLARCSRTRKPYCISFERTSAKEWTATWSFPIQEAAAARRNYASDRISGLITSGADFPGCPHCHNRGFFKENCGKVGCWDGINDFITCPWCGAQGELRGRITDVDGTTELE
jgi:hypothetical protein